MTAFDETLIGVAAVVGVLAPDIGVPGRGVVGLEVASLLNPL